MRGTLFGGSSNKDDSILGSISGSPRFKLPYSGYIVSKRVSLFSQLHSFQQQPSIGRTRTFGAHLPGEQNLQCWRCVWVLGYRV